MNAETVIAKHNQSTNNRSISSEEYVHDKSASSHDPSVKSQEVGDMSRDPSVRSHDLQEGRSPGGPSSRDLSQSLPSTGRTSDGHGDVSDHTDGRGTDANFRPWEKPFGNNMLDIKQYQGIDTYEIRLRIREQEAIQMMVEKQKELMRQREVEEMKLRERIRSDLEEEAKRFQQHEEDPMSEMSYRGSKRSNQLYVSDDTISKREFRTPERHVPDITQSTGRSRSHDQRTESGYYDERPSSSHGGKNSYEINATQPVRGDRSSNRQSSYVPESRQAFDEFYSQRRSPYGAANGEVGLKASTARSSFTVDTAVVSNSDSDRPQSDDFQPLQAEQVHTENVKIHFPPNFQF